MPNAYQKRLEHRQTLSHERADKIYQAKQMERSQRCTALERAYTAFMAEAGSTVKCLVHYNKGWYYFHGKAYQATRIEQLTKEFEVRLHELRYPYKDNDNDR